ncbi:PfaB family protein [uncultured Shewanella sp.]|uniref:PfaB family protein n=1 Tax=uncultured Shewanella sp. TaxID=173975 RepID=UPI002628553C|nr:PfaB family protein [uncultured Shewanella sp.]
MSVNNLDDGSLKPSKKALRIALFIQANDVRDAKKQRLPVEEANFKALSMDIRCVVAFEQDLDSAIQAVCCGNGVKLIMPEYTLIMLPALKAAKLKLHPHALLSAFQWQSVQRGRAYQVLEQQAIKQVRGETHHSDIKSVSYDDLNSEQKCLQFCQWVINLMNRTLVTETQSHFWFRAPYKPRMVAMNFGFSEDNLTTLPEIQQQSCIILTQGTYQTPAKSLIHSEQLFFIFNGHNQSELQQALVRLTQSLAIDDVCVLTLMAENLRTYVNIGQGSFFSVVLQATSISGLKQEIDNVFKAIPKVIAAKGRYRTPSGSCFFAKPLTDVGLTFVYPGVGTVFDKMLSQLHEYFPELYQTLEGEGDLRDILQSEKIYQDIELNELSFEEKKKESQWDKLISIRRSSADEKGMSLAEQAISGVGSSYLLTKLLTREFDITPRFAMGYSMGEVSMWACLGVWKNPYEMVEDTFTTGLFSSMVSGRLDAVRKAWGLKDEGQFNQVVANKENDPQSVNCDSKAHERDELHQDKVCWGSFLLRKPAKEINAIIDNYPRVYLAINQGETCIISGCEESCKALISALGTKAMTSSGVSAMHTGPAMLVHQETYDFYLRPLNDFSQRPFLYDQPHHVSTKTSNDTVDPTQITFISSQLKRGIHYKHNPFCGKTIAKSVADNLCYPLDFPKHVENARRLGANLFLEVGADKQNTILINRINQADSVDDKCDAMAVNSRAVDDVKGLLNIIAQLISHRVPLSLKVLQRSVGTLLADKANDAIELPHASSPLEKQQ